VGDPPASGLRPHPGPELRLTGRLHADKALGERVAEQLWAQAGRPLSVVRPAIVESALRHPYPGWIDGFKMADPLIIAFAKGVLREFPGLPDSVLDMIPVDLVVNAILAAAARPPIAPPAGQPAYLHVSSGASNPLTFQNMYVLCREYFDNNPVPDGDRGHVQPPTWRFSGSQQVELTLSAGERAATLAEKVLLALPPSTRCQGWLASLGHHQQELAQLREYVDLYGLYARAEVIYDDRRLRELHASLPAQRATKHGFDPTVSIGGPTCRKCTAHRSQLRSAEPGSGGGGPPPDVVDRRRPSCPSARMWLRCSIWKAPLSTPMSSRPTCGPGWRPCPVPGGYASWPICPLCPSVPLRRAP
jgi:hypothetical protein